MSREYKFHNKAGLYFVSFATVYWLDIFTRQAYFNVLANNVTYCRAHNGMELYAYCFMPSHVHIVFCSANDQPMELLRDFKKHTSKKVVEAIANNSQESRKAWLLWLLERAGRKSGNGSQFELWQHHNQPIELWTDKVIKQKINYIHNNPVVVGLVTDPIHYKYSSARNYQDDHTVLEIDDPGFNGLRSFIKVYWGRHSLQTRASGSTSVA